MTVVVIISVLEYVCEKVIRRSGKIYVFLACQVFMTYFVKINLYKFLCQLPNSVDLKCHREYNFNYKYEQMFVFVKNKGCTQKQEEIMEQTKYCIYCSSELKMNFGFLYKEMLCPHCSAILKYRKNLFGHQIIEARYAGDTEYERIIIKRGGTRRNG